MPLKKVVFIEINCLFSYSLFIHLIILQRTLYLYLNNKFQFNLSLASNWEKISQE